LRSFGISALHFWKFLSTSTVHSTGITHTYTAPARHFPQLSYGNILAHWESMFCWRFCFFHHLFTISMGPRPTTSPPPKITNYTHQKTTILPFILRHIRRTTTQSTALSFFCIYYQLSQFTADGGFRTLTFFRRLISVRLCLSYSLYILSYLSHSCAPRVLYILLR